MLLYKFSKILLLSFLFSISLQAEIRFDAKNCLEQGFQTEVVHKGHPFGLTETKLAIEKEGCVIKISHESLNFFKNAWEVDVCRAPVHVKSGAGAVTVLRREAHCVDNENSRYCQEIEKIDKILQNDGLIFASGEKENIETPHGQIHCSYTLIRKYLFEGQVLSRHGMEDVFAPSPVVESAKPLEKMQSANADEEFPESEEPGKF